MGKCLLHAQCSDLCFVVTDTRVKEPGVRRQCDMERNPKDSVVCGVKGYAQGAPVEPPSMQLVCASYVPKLKLPCPRASLVFSWRQVAALPRLGLWRGDPSACLCTDRCTYGLGAQGHPGLLLPR